jgi:serine/threonine protein kinase
VVNGPNHDAESGHPTQISGGQVRGASQRPAPPGSEALRSDAGSADETLVEGESNGGNEAGLKLVPGTKIGRYVSIEKLGSGGMGVVWAAYDPELDRRVAVKLLRNDGRSAKRREVARLRLQREAQAMAKLSHPNVVTVHDVGTHEGQIFVAMAHLGGGTLKQYFERSKPGWERVVELMCSAGDGLLAAHKAGLIHRDFKPENVLLDDEGHPLVVDFGLVRATEATSEDLRDTAQDDERASSGALSTSVTRAGAVMGTPAYMAPEQHMGREATEVSDQFSFCVTLYEGLFGRSPFPARTLIGLAERVLAGKIEPPPADNNVPAHIRQALLRGLSLDPADRFASMTDLLAALRDDRARRRRRTLTSVAMGGAAAIAIAAATPSSMQCGVMPREHDSRRSLPPAPSHTPATRSSARAIASTTGVNVGPKDTEKRARPPSFATSNRPNYSTRAWLASTRACAHWSHGSRC